MTKLSFSLVQPPDLRYLITSVITCNLFQSLLGNVTFFQGLRRFVYAVSPRETSFAMVEDVPDYLNEVKTPTIVDYNGTIPVG